MTQFSDLKLDPKVLKAIDEAGYTTPTPIQAGAIPPALEGRDVLGIAQTGTGKTASFTLPMITLLGRGRARARMPRSLVLCPTRELAAQVAENFDIYAKHTRLTKALLIGGVSMRDQEMLIDRGVDVLIATPGRLLDHFERGNLLLQGVQIMVVDEADRMLDMGFIPDIERIFQLTPFTRQTLFFSATMAPEIERITNTFLTSPERIEVARQATTSETITQKLVELTPTRKDQTAKQKRELLRALIEAEGPADQDGGVKNAIIFCNRKTEVDIVAKSLKTHGYDAAPIHGDLDQRQRTATLEGFRDGSLRFLIASDVAARGLDIPAVSHVFNFDLPSHAEDYVHRIGRTGRAGRLGTAISISTPADEKYLAAIENLVKHELPRGEMPEGFSLSDAARSAPREPRESDRGGRSGSSRGGSRTRSRARKDDAHTAAHAPALPEAVEVKQHAAPVELPEATPPTPTPPARAEHGGERRNGNRDNNARDDRSSERREQRPPRDERKDDRRDRSRDRDRGPAVLGMGDHVPDFMLTSFRTTETTAPEAPQADAAKVEIPRDEPAKAKTEQPKPVQVEAEKPVATPVDAEVSTEPAAPTEAEVSTETPAAVDAPAEAPVVAEKPPAKRRTRTRKVATPTEAVADQPAPEAAATEAAAPPAEPAAEPEAKPKPKRAPRPRKKKEAPAPVDEAATAAPVPDQAAPADAPTAEAAPQVVDPRPDDAQS